MLAVALSLTVAPAARAVNNVPDAMPTGTETVLYSFGVGPTAGKCKINDGADPKGSLTFVTATGSALRRAPRRPLRRATASARFSRSCPAAPATRSITFSQGAKTDGNDPQHNAMTLVGTVLYGTTLTGGQHDNGSIFSINDDGTGYSSPLLFDFPTSAANNSGDQPYSNFVAIGSVLYGMTSQGGHQWRLDRGRHYFLLRTPRPALTRACTPSTARTASIRMAS